MSICKTSLPRRASACWRVSRPLQYLESVVTKSPLCFSEAISARCLTSSGASQALQSRFWTRVDFGQVHILTLDWPTIKPPFQRSFQRSGSLAIVSTSRLASAVGLKASHPPPLQVAWLHLPVIGAATEYTHHTRHLELSPFCSEVRSSAPPLPTHPPSLSALSARSVLSTYPYLSTYPLRRVSHLAPSARPRGYYQPG